MFITGIEGEKLSELLHFRTRWPLELWPGLHQTESGLVSDRNTIQLSFNLAFLHSALNQSRDFFKV